jgi:putative tryptophan/tyrosine transport system substrate-binding protein
MMECWTIRLKTFFQHSNIPSARMFWLFCAMLFALCSAAEAQQPAKIPRIGFLAASSAPIAATRIDAFRQGLRALGYVEGKDIAIEFRFAEGKPDQLPHYAAELVRLKVDIIITLGPMDTRAARDATKTIPIVMGQDSDPVGSGVVASLARPGGNITGLSSLYPEITGKQLELLKENVPTLSRVAVLGNSTEPGNALLLKEMELAAGALKVQLKYLDVRDPADIETAFSAIKKDRADAVIVLRNPIASTRRKQIVDLAAKSRLPAIYVQPEWVEAGGLMSYAPDLRDNWRRAATYVDKILKGVKPADLPVEQPTKFELVINLKAAKQIGLTIPPNVLGRADRVIR